MSESDWRKVSNIGGGCCPLSCDNGALARPPPAAAAPFRFVFGKVATYRHVYRAEPKEPTQFGSVSGSEIQNLPFPLSGIVSLYRSEPKGQT